MENKVWFYYEFKGMEEILSWVKDVSEYWPIDFVLPAILVALVFLAVFYIVPFIFVVQENSIKEKRKREKKKMLSKIRLQSQIEDEVDKELKEEDYKKMSERKKALEL